MAAVWKGLALTLAMGVAGQGIALSDETRTPVTVSLAGKEGRPAESVHLLLKPRRGLRAALSVELSPTIPWPTYAMPRGGATPEQVSAALSLARARFHELAERPARGEGRSDEAYAAELDRRGEALLFCMRILWLFGTEDDARSLVETETAADVQWPASRWMAAGLLESRLGRIEDGVLAETLRHPDPERARWAAAVLHSFGSGSGDAVLLDALRDPECSNPVIQNEALTIESADVLPALRAILDLAIQRQVEPPVGVRIGLLALGTREDRRRVEEAPMPASMALALIPFVDDPLPLETAYLSSLARAGNLSESSLAEVATRAGWLRGLPAEKAEASFLALCDLAFEFGKEANPGASEEDAYTNGLRWLNRAHLIATSWFPDRRAAQLLYQGYVPPPQAIWLPATSVELAEIVRHYAGGTLASPRYLAQLDFWAPDAVAREFEAQRVAESAACSDIVLTAHRVSTSAFVCDWDRAFDRTVRRPYMLLNRDSEGALSGVLEATPRVVESSLRIALRIRQACFLQQYGNFINAAMKPHDFETYQYTLDGGRRLLKEVRLRRGDTTIPLVALDRGADGAFEFEAPFDGGALDGLWLEVDLGFFQRTETIAFDLFAGGAARDMRRAAAVLATIEGNGTFVGTMARAEALATLGRIDDAARAWRNAQALRPFCNEPWTAAVRMFEGIGDRGRAAAFIESVLVARPNDTVLLYDLALSRYEDREYEAAAEACARALGSNPADDGARQLLARIRFLQGDRGAALTLLAGVKTAPAPEEHGALSVLASGLGAGQPPAEIWLADHDAEVLLAQDEGAFQDLLDAAEVEEGPRGVCRLRCLQAYWHLLHENPDAARAGFEQCVLLIEASDTLYHHLAESELSLCK